MSYTDRRKPSSGAGSPAGLLAQTRENKQVIQASMKRWQSLNKYGRSIGRGLSESELMEKVSGETGASMRHIRRSLKQKV